MAHALLRFGPLNSRDWQATANPGFVEIDHEIREALYYAHHILEDEKEASRISMSWQRDIKNGGDPLHVVSNSLIVSLRSEDISLPRSPLSLAVITLVIIRSFS
jgi:hypothetical protein